MVSLGLVEHPLDARIALTEMGVEWEGHHCDIGANENFTPWFMGINQNIPGRQKRRFLLYAGGAPAYREKCDDVAANGYDGFVFRR